MKYIITLQYDSPWGPQRSDITVDGHRDIRSLMAGLNPVDLKRHLLKQTTVDPETVGDIIVVSVVSEEPMTLPSGDHLVVFAMNLAFNEEAADGNSTA